MNNMLKRSNKFFYVLMSVLAGACVFILFISFSLRLTLLNGKFHKRLFDKNEVYPHIQNIIKASMPELFTSIGTDVSQNLQGQKDALSVLENSFTDKMLKENIDSVIEGIFAYLEGKTSVLPYIQLANRSESPMETNSSQSQTLNISGVDKINLGAILMYSNRADTAEVIFSTRYIFYLVKAIPGILLSIIFLLFIIVIGICRSISYSFKWAAKSISIGGIMLLILGCTLIGFTLLIMPSVFYPFAMSLPFENKLLISYIRNSFIPLSLLTLLFGILAIALPNLIYTIVKFARSKLKICLTAEEDIPALSGRRNSIMIDSHTQLMKSIAPIFYLALLLSAAVLTTSELKAFKTNSVPNGLNSLISRFKSINSSTRIVPAKDETIYILEVRLNENGANSGIEGVNVNIRGKSSRQEKYFNETGITDINGMVRFSLDKGTYQASFYNGESSSEYILPSPFFVSLKTAGTTITTINIDNADKVNKGVAEIEVLDEKGKPVPNLRLYVDNQDASQETPEKIFSYTNPEGIAMFKLNKGIHKVYFDNTLFPAEYIPPAEMEVTTNPASLNRYTISLVQKKAK